MKTSTHGTKRCASLHPKMNNLLALEAAEQTLKQLKVIEQNTSLGTARRWASDMIDEIEDLKEYMLRIELAKCKDDPSTYTSAFGLCNTYAVDIELEGIF